MTEQAKNQIGILHSVLIFTTIVAFIYLIQTTNNLPVKYFIIGLFEIFLSGILLLGASRPHKCLFYRMFPLIVGFYLYPFVGKATPYYLAGLGIILGVGFFTVGVISYIGIV